MINLKLHFVGAGDAELNLPPGSETFQLYLSPSGHLMLPVSEFQNHKKQGKAGGSTEGSLDLEPQISLPTGGQGKQE